jgi:hypothetical protein
VGLGDGGYEPFGGWLEAQARPHAAGNAAAAAAVAVAAAGIEASLQPYLLRPLLHL